MHIENGIQYSIYIACNSYHSKGPSVGKSVPSVSVMSTFCIDENVYISEWLYAIEELVYCGVNT